MAKAPGNEGCEPDASSLSHWLRSFEKASSEHKKAIIILDHIVPFIQSKASTHLDITIILESVITKYASCTSRQLHNAFHTLFNALNSVNRVTFLSTITQQLDIVVNRANAKANAPGNYFTLLEWVNQVLTLSAEEENNFAKYLAGLVTCQATLLHHCLAEGKKGVKQSALRGTRASLRSVFYKKDHSSFGETSVQSFVKILAGSKIPPLAAAIGLGVLAGVCRRLGDRSPSKVVESSKSTYYDFFIREIVGSKVRIPEYILVEFNWFIEGYTTQEDFENILAAPLERGMLRSPELVFNDVIPPLCSALNEDIDLSNAVAKALLPQLLTSLKSTNASLRESSLKAGLALLSRCHDVAGLKSISDLLLKTLKDERLVDTRVAVTELLESLANGSTTLSSSVIQTLQPLFAKETNDAVLTGLIEAFCAHIRVLLQKNTPLEGKSVNLVVSGLTDKRAKIKTAWTVATSQIITKFDYPSTADAPIVVFSKATTKPLFGVLSEVANNAVQATQAGTVIGGYAVIIAALGTWMQWTNAQELGRLVKSEGVLSVSTTIASKPSFLINERIYTKLGSQREKLWAIGALGAAGQLSITEMDVFWPIATIFFITDPKATKTIRDAAHSMLTLVLSGMASENRKRGAELMIRGFEDWLRQISEERKDSPAMSSGPCSLLLLRDVVTSMLTGELLADPSYVSFLLVRLFATAHHPRLPRYQWSWIDIVRMANMDPGTLVTEQSTDFLAVITQKFWPSEKNIDFQEAAVSACQTLAFVAPETAIPVLLSQVRQYLSSEVYAWISATDIQIWRGADGTVVIDPLAKPANGVSPRPGKSAKKGDWEAELRAELEKKKGAKLSAKDQALVNEQIAKESGVRARVEEVRHLVKTGLGIIQSLIDVPAGLGVDLWFHEVLQILVGGVVQRCGELVAEDAVRVFLNLTGLISPRLGFFRVPIGVTLLRRLNVAQVPENWMEESLEDMTLRVLYRLRFLSEQHPLDRISYQFCLPLALDVLNVSILTDKQRTEAEEQITLVLEFISFQASDNQELPRIQILERLLDVLLLVPSVSKLARDTFLQVTDIISANESKEELSVLIHALLSRSPNVRTAVLQALESFDLEETESREIIFLATQDADERNAELAVALYETNSLAVGQAALAKLFALLEHDTKYVRDTTAKALSVALPDQPELFEEYLKKLMDLYQERAKPIAPKKDRYGMVMREQPDSLTPAKIRLSVAQALRHLGPVVPETQVESILNFMITAEALGDKDAEVSEKMLSAGLILVEHHGKQNLEGVLQILNGYLDAPAKSSEVHDRIREACVILLGSTARHLEVTDERTDSIIDKLLATLRTPSESVQTAVCDCLPPLIKSRVHRVPDLTSALLATLTTATKYAERRGAAYGIAGIVAGAGIGSLYSPDILSTLASAALNKKEARSREGALFTYEALLYALGRLFEPFIATILPFLLVTYGDSAAEVRNATSDTAKMIMRTISGHCVKEILPSLLGGLDEPQWRSKKGSIEMLGTMAYLAPKQLSISLPAIVPKLTSVLTDSHPQVRAAANTSLLKFGEVISNPEVQDMVPVLLKALGDPNKFTEPALDNLLSTPFIHYIDGPSLALILPIISRGLKERTASTRRKSARILGSLGNLTDQRDLVTYLNELLPPLREILSDAIPENRASAAASLGALVEKMGEDSFPDLIDSLMDDLKIEAGGIGRLGSAQALSEVLSALGLHRLEDVLPSILSATESAKASIREAFINLLVYLPATFGNRFQPYLTQTVPKILSGLADEVEVVREAALRAGRIVVTNYAIKAVDIILPQLENAFFVDRWQIRHSAVELVGTMMYQLIGLNKVPDTEDEEDRLEEATETQRAALVEVLGQERRDRILCALYIARQDVSGIVRQAAAQVFKTLVSNPQRTVREMLPTMANMIVKNLSSADEERRLASAKTLGDIVRKFGQGTLSELLPLLQEGLHSHDPVHVQGICIALVEVMNSASKDALDNFQDILCESVKEALQYPNAEVQNIAAQSFEALQHQFPTKAIEGIIPTLLRQLESEDEGESEVALVALREIMKNRSNTRILGSLLPSLTALPITAVNAKALSSLIEAAGEAIYYRLAYILQSITDSVLSVKDTDWSDALTKSFQIIAVSVDEDEGIRIVLTTLFSALKHENPKRRAFAINQAAVFFKESDEDFSRYASQWATALVSSFADRDTGVVQSAIQALVAMTSKLPQDEQEECVSSTRQAVLSVSTEGHDLPGFTQPGGVTSVLNIYLAGLKRSSAEEAANGIAELVMRTNLASLKPVTVQMIGALIRSIGERHPSAGKAAILHALSTILQKAPLLAKPFIPQLQRTAVKNLSDQGSGDIRNQAAVVLGVLIPMQPRVDPLVSELVTAANNSFDDGVKIAIIKALSQVFSKVGKAVGDAQKTAVTELIHQVFQDGRGPLVPNTAYLMSLLLKYLNEQTASRLLQTDILEAEITQNSVMALNGLLLDPPTAILNRSLDEILDVSLNAALSREDAISESGILALGKLITNESIEEDMQLKDSIFNTLTNIIRQPPSGSTDSQRVSLVVVRTVSRKNYGLIQPYIHGLIDPVVNCARDSNVLPLKVAAERAFFALFKMESEGTALLDEMLEGGDPVVKKHVQEYTRRIAGKIAALESMDGEKQDELDDEREISSIGGMAFL